SYMSRDAPRSTLLPYTTLFRSADDRVGKIGEQHGGERRQGQRQRAGEQPAAELRQLSEGGGFRPLARGQLREAVQDEMNQQQVRSEEHTSELQSRENLVCRLLP